MVLRVRSLQDAVVGWAVAGWAVAGWVVAGWAVAGGALLGVGCNDKGASGDDSGTAADGGSSDGGSGDGGDGGDGGADCGPGTTDQDCDGVSTPDDCDDLDAAVWPGAPEQCGDDRDEDCDGVAAPCAPVGTVDARSGLMLLAPDPGGFGGAAVSIVPDLDGDGFDELLASANRASTTAVRGGAAYLLLGPVHEAESLADAALELRGEQQDWLGTSLGFAGDVDGDGQGDLLIGAPGDLTLDPTSTPGAGPGRVLLLSGAARGLVEPREALAILAGEATGDKAGCSVSAGGDLDGDGIGDVLVGAYLHGTAADGGGAAYAVHGPLEGTSSLADADLRLLGTLPYEQAGASVQAIGDVTGDGYGDLLISADGDEGDRPGRAYLVAGPLIGSHELGDVYRALMESDEDNDNAGSTAWGGQDLDGDLVPDFLLCAYDAQQDGIPVGAAYVLSGPLSGVVGIQDAARTTVRGVEGLPHAGESCGIVGDIDHDGRPDVAFGAHDHGADGEGRVYLFYDLPEGEVSVEDAQAIVLSTQPEEDLGWSLDGGGDLDGDGFDDLAIGARRASVSADLQGGVFVLSGGVQPLVD